MDPRINDYLNLYQLFKENGFQLFLVGGTVRDYLLGIPLTDMDAVSDATPEQMKKFLPTADYTFERFGSVRYHNDRKVKFDITTLREEKAYYDRRHPEKVKFIKDLRVDAKRRDFTINALYLNGGLNVLDYVDGEKDLNDRVLRMIGDPKERLMEDPLRIIRAFRFASDFDLSIDEELSEGIKECSKYIEKLNFEKIKDDLKKAKPESKEKIIRYFEDYNIKLPKDMLE